MRYFFFFTFILFNIYLSNASAKNLQIQGLSRLSISDVQSLSSVDLYKKDFLSNDINLLVKELYLSDQFYNLKLIENDQTFILNVEESPIIENIFINGNIKFKDQFLIDFLNSKKSDFLNKTKINNDISLIQNIYKSNGFLSTQVFVTTEKFSESKINLIFNINEGNLFKVNNINLFGNDSFSTKLIKSKIQSKEVSFYNIFDKGSNLNNEIFENDLNIIKNYYYRKGFPNINVSYMVKKNLVNSYSLNFYINEGNRTIIDEIIFDFKIDLITEDLNHIKNEILIEFKDNKSLDLDTLDEFKLKFNEILAKFRLNLKIDYNINISDNNAVVTFFSSFSELKTINTIEIYGNKITKTDILLSKIDILPGDYFNEPKIKKTIDTLENLKYINKVDYKVNDLGDSKLNLIYDLEENSKTGNFLMGGSFNGDLGLGLIFSLKDENLFGTGNELLTEINANKEQFQFSIDYTKTSVRNPLISNSYSINNKELNFTDSYGFKAKEKSFTYSVNQKINETTNFIIGASYSNTIGYAGVNSDLPIEDNIGTFDDFNLNLSLNQNNTNDFLYPSDGYSNYISLHISPDQISDNSFYKATFKNNYYLNLNGLDNYIFLSNNFGISEAISGNLKTINTFRLGGLNFKGFDYMGVGLKSSSNTYVGGNKYFTTTLGYGSSFIFDKSDNIYFKMFYSLGSIWDSDYIDQEFKLRSSIGASFDILSPVGPIAFSYAVPLVKESFDIEQNFNFTIGTAF